MCGRYLSLSDPGQLAERFGVDQVRTEPLPTRYNVAPSEDVYAVIERDAARRLGALCWGFVPHWTRELRGARTPINTRLESVASSKMFADAFARHRCLLPADGFWEWHRPADGGRKQAYHLADPDGQPLALAGIWSRAHPSDRDEPVSSAAVVTTAARGGLEAIHERMPLVLPASWWDQWLTADPESADGLRDQVAALDPPRLTARPVTDRVNSVANEGPELLEPAPAV